MSLTGAFLAVFIQQWALSYLQATQGRHSPRDRARIRTHHAEGLDKLHLHRVTREVPILIHLSLFFFFSGLPSVLVQRQPHSLQRRTHVARPLRSWVCLHHSCRSFAMIAHTIHHFLHRSGGVLPTCYSSSIDSSVTSCAVIPLFSGGIISIMRGLIFAGRLWAL
jgi:hypothetical protein